MIYGVSPAFVISKYGQSFTVNQFSEALVDIAELGYNCFQPEVFQLEELDKWYSGGAKKVSIRSTELNLSASQFVAHFLLKSFSTPERLFSDYGFEELKKVVDITKKFDDCSTIVVPFGKFEIENYNDIEPNTYEKLKFRLINKLSKFLEIVTSADMRLALEIMPYSIIDGTSGFLEIYKSLNSRDFGVSLDTGHAWASRELVELLPLKLKEKIFGLHLCDNFSDVNNSLAPGKGSINWELFFKNISLSSYKGSYDIEIICPSEKIEEEYKWGLMQVINYTKIKNDKVIK